MELDIEIRFLEPLFTLLYKSIYQILNYKTLSPQECIQSVLVKKSVFNFWFPNLDSGYCHYEFSRRNDVTRWFRIINIITRPNTNNWYFNTIMSFNFYKHS